MSYFPNYKLNWRLFMSPCIIDPHNYINPYFLEVSCFNILVQPIGYFLSCYPIALRVDYRLQKTQPCNIVFPVVLLLIFLGRSVYRQSQCCRIEPWNLPWKTVPGHGAGRHCHLLRCKMEDVSIYTNWHQIHFLRWRWMPLWLLFGKMSFYIVRLVMGFSSLTQCEDGVSSAGFA